MPRFIYRSHRLADFKARWPDFLRPLCGIHSSRAPRKHGSFVRGRAMRTDQSIGRATGIRPCDGQDQGWITCLNVRDLSAHVSLALSFTSTSSTRHQTLTYDYCCKDLKDRAGTGWVSEHSLRHHLHSPLSILIGACASIGALMCQTPMPARGKAVFYGHINNLFNCSRPRYRPRLRTRLSMVSTT